MKYLLVAYNKKKSQFVGNKAKGRISKRVFQEYKAHQIFRKILPFALLPTNYYVLFESQLSKILNVHIS